MNRFLLLFFIISGSAIAQNDIHKKVADTFIEQFNNGDFEGIYESFSPKMKKAKTKKQYFEFLLKVKTDAGNLQHLELFNYFENKNQTARGSYNGHFQNTNATVRITTNAQGEITGLYIKKAAIL